MKDKVTKAYEEIVNINNIRIGFFIGMIIIIITAILGSIYYTMEEANIFWGMAIGMVTMLVIVIFATKTERGKRLI